MKMMKLSAAFIAVLFLLISNQKTFGQGNDKLDSVIRNLSDYLNTRIPKGNKVVFLNVNSDWPDFSEYILSSLVENAVNDEVFSVVERRQLDDLRSELKFQLSGEVSDKSAQEIGQMIGAEIIVSGMVTEVGNEYRIQVRAISVQTAAVMGLASRNVSKKGPIVTALTTAVTDAVAREARKEVNTQKRQASANKFFKNSGFGFGGWFGFLFSDSEDKMFLGGGDIELRLFRFFGLQSGIIIFQDLDTVNPFSEPLITQSILQIPIVARLSFPLSDNFFVISGYGGLGINTFIGSNPLITIQSTSPYSLIAGAEFGISLADLSLLIGYQINRDLSETMYDYGPKKALCYNGERSILTFGFKYFTPFR
jgi:hypothetical protein